MKPRADLRDRQSRSIRRPQHFHVERTAAGRLRLEHAGAVDLKGIDAGVGVGMLRTWLKPVKRARSCRPSSDSTTGFVVVCRARAGLDINGDDGMKRLESLRTPPLMGKTPFLLPARALPLRPVRSTIPDPEPQLARIPPTTAAEESPPGGSCSPILWFTIGQRGHRNESLPKKATFRPTGCSGSVCFSRGRGRDHANSREVRSCAGPLLWQARSW